MSATTCGEIRVDGVAVLETDGEFRERYESLTPRQREVLGLRCERGLSRLQIAECLGKAPETIRTHMNRMLAVLDPLPEGATRREALGMAQICYRLGRMAR